MFNIAVVGAGVVGLPTALQLQKEFGPKTKVTIFSENESPNTTGDVAAGIWNPYALGETPQDKVIQWAKTTQDYILKFWKDGKAEEMGISLQPCIELTNEKDFVMPEWLKITLGYSELPRSELEHYNKRYDEKFTGGFAYVSFSWEASKFLPFFKNTFLKSGGVIYQRKIQNFDELSNYDVIVNCTGLNSKYLVPDPSVHPIRGQIIRVDAPWQYHTLLIDKEQGNVIIPNQECVILGLTHQVGDYNTNIDENDKKHIFEGCSLYVPALSKAPIIKHQAGLRPGRCSLRLEIEHRKSGDKIMKIVHNYGHGGSGITLSIGCAVEATQLVKKALGFAGLSKL